MFTSEKPISNVFASGILTAYNELWKVENSRKFSQEEIDAVESNVVTRGEYGLSVCFMLKNKKSFYIPVSSRNTELTEGQSVDMSSITLLTLSQNGRKCVKIQ